MIIHAMTTPAPVLPGGTCALPHLGVIAAVGPDAASFLHGQLTQDFSLLDGSQARLAALCTAKGRMIASFVGIRPEPETMPSRPRASCPVTSPAFAFLPAFLPNHHSARGPLCTLT